MSASKPVSEIEVANLALLQLHQGAITSVDDENDPAAVAVKRIIAQRRRSVLRNYVWNFAKKRALAARVTSAAPAFDYDSYYQLPNDLVRLLWVGEDADRYNPYDWDIEGRYLLLAGTENSVKITYTRDVTDVTLWDSLFVDVIVLEIADHLCMPITGDRALQQMIQARLKEIRAEAVAVDHQERPVRVTEMDRIAQARMLDSEIPQLDVSSSVEWN